MSTDNNRVFMSKSQWDYMSAQNVGWHQGEVPVIELTTLATDDTMRDMAELERLERLADLQDSAARLEALAGVVLGLGLAVFVYNIL